MLIASHVITVLTRRMLNIVGQSDEYAEIVYFGGEVDLYVVV